VTRLESSKEGFVNYFGLPELLFLRVGGIVIILPLWKVFSKAGYPGSLSLGNDPAGHQHCPLVFYRVQRLAGTAGVERVAYTEGPAPSHVVVVHYPASQAPRGSALIRGT
jgi:hypothetical protein